MISKIGFKNFRRFQDEISMPLGGINIFVGGNNAGKSTAVKAMLLIVNFLKNTTINRRSLYDRPGFYFDIPYANIDTFSRALNWNAKDEDKLKLSASFDEFDVTVSLHSKSTEDENYADIDFIELRDNSNAISFKFDFSNSSTTIHFGFDNSTEDADNMQAVEMRRQLESEISSLQSQLQSLMEHPSSAILDESNYILHEIADKKKDYEKLSKSMHNVANESIEISLAVDCNNIGRNYISALIDGARQYAYSGKNKNIKSKIKQYESLLRQIADYFARAVDRQYTEYIYAHSAVQKVLFNKKDLNDYLSAGISELYDLKITSLSSVGKMMKGWLKDFTDIEDYKIVKMSGDVRNTRKRHEAFIGQGEGYAFGVKVEGKWHDLGDMGRGTIQLMILFMHLAIIIKKYQNSTDKPIVLVEEPEQNLHPAVQSKLADLFYDIYNEFGFHFVIETHSEYLVRKTQVLVAENIKNDKFDLQSNPFIVYFFDKDDGPYDMVYRINGRFEKEFKTSFFEEAADLAFKLF